MTNKTDKNSNAIRAAAQLQSEQTSTDTNKLSTYEVVFVLAQRSSGRVLIEALTPEEAHQKAREIELHAVENWEIFEDEMSIESIEVVNGGESDE